MSSGAERPPVVLAISGHDPTGAAGIHADLEAIAQGGAACASLITATTAQNTQSFEKLFPQPPKQFLQAAECLLSDMKVDACKVGLLGSVSIARCVASLTLLRSGIPVVIDPITHSGTGADLGHPGLLRILATELVPLATIVTPNCREACELTGLPEAEHAAQRLLELGCENVLLTGADQDTEVVYNRLYRNNHPVMTYEYRRLPHTYHGSGCTLSAFLAALLARGMDVQAAVEQAQAFTHVALQRGRQLGHGQWHPGRIAQTAPGD